MSVLFINACVRADSRTLVLAKDIMKDIKDELIEVNLNELNISPLNRDTLNMRDSLVRDKRFEDDMFCYARQFANADEIFIATPFWDLSFPALLKAYFEQITVAGITFEYQNGHPVGLCKGKRLTYITTSGGPIFEDYGYTYIRSLAKNFYGISKTRAFRAMNLDVDMLTTETVLTKATVTEIE